MSNDDETVERVARAICFANGQNPDDLIQGAPLWWEYLPHARAALEHQQKGEPK